MKVSQRIILTPGLAAAIFYMAAATGCQQAEYGGKIANLAVATKIRKSLVGENAAGGEDAAEATGTGWATLKGRFVFDGDPPQMPPYGVNKDEAVCAPGGQAPPQEYLVVDSGSKGIANIFIYPRKVSRANDSAAASTEPFVFDQKECRFLSHAFAVSVGQPVEIHNSDPVGHNTSIAGQNTFNQMIPSGGNTPYSAKAEEAVPAPISCSVHPWMRAYMLPRKNAYVAVTKADGSFEIPNLPAGELLEFQVWHENAAGGKGALFVEDDAAKELKWDNKGRFKIKLEPDETRELNITVPASAFGG
jgi:plastocyanin